LRCAELQIYDMPNLDTETIKCTLKLGL